MLKKLFLIATLLVGVAHGFAAETNDKKGPLYATLKTSMGDIVIQLFDDKAPEDRRELRRPGDRNQGVGRSQERGRRSKSHCTTAPSFTASSPVS